MCVCYGYRKWIRRNGGRMREKEGGEGERERALE
jgi:hypothetical protein